jgi:hypothetical protein
MAASNIVAFFIILTTAALHANGKIDISSAAEAAEATASLSHDMRARSAACIACLG